MQSRIGPPKESGKSKAYFNKQIKRTTKLDYSLSKYSHFEWKTEELKIFWKNSNENVREREFDV